MNNWDKLRQFLQSLKCSFEKKECLQIVAHKQALGLHSREIESISTNDTCTDLTIYYKPVAGQGDFDWVKI